MATTPPNNVAPRKTRRPVLPPHTAHAHAFAALSPPGENRSSSSLYFPLPTPPAPLRSFTLTQNGEPGNDLEASTQYPTTASSRRDPKPARRNSKENPKRDATDRLASLTPKDKPLANTKSSACSHQFEFASAAPYSANNTGSSGLSSSSGRSALGIAEIDCFFVQGSRSSTYSARSHSSSRSRAPSEGTSGPAPLSELGLGSSDELVEEPWTSDEAERERRREERRAFMKARQSLREEVRRRRLGSGGEELGLHPNVTWREVIQARAVMPLKGIPPARISPRTTTPRQSLEAQEGLQVSLADGLITQSPPPSGPGPPDEPVGDAAAVDTLASLFSGLSLGASGGEQASDPIPFGDTLPSLSRFDSDHTALGSPST